MRRIGWVVAGAVLCGLVPGTVPAQTGEFRLNAGLAVGLGSEGLPASLVSTASFSFVASSFSFGPEILYVTGDPRILGVGVVSRLQLNFRGFRPYLVGGVGGDYWQRPMHVTAGLFTGNIGAGIRLGGDSQLALVLEARAHKNLQNYQGGGRWDFVTITLGGRLGW
jgi:hypothetical protein